MSVGSHPFVAFISIFMALSSILCPSVAQACKDRKYPATFPAEELQNYEHLYVIRVDRLAHVASSEVSRYAQPFSFEGKVIRVFKGSKKAGDIVRAVTSSGEEAHARCPISLESGKMYLLMLNGSGATYTLPRYGSLYVSSDRPEFDSYLADLTKDSR